MQPFPAVIVRMASDPRVKKALYLEYDKIPGECENCGGMGVISLFLATLGPLDAPAGGKFTSKWHDDKWWAAPSPSMQFGTVSAPCPVCHGIKKGGKPVYVPMPDEIRGALNKILGKMRIA